MQLTNMTLAHIIVRSSLLPLRIQQPFLRHTKYLFVKCEQAAPRTNKLLSGASELYRRGR